MSPNCCDNLKEFVLDINPLKACLINTVLKPHPELFQTSSAGVFIIYLIYFWESVFYDNLADPCWVHNMISKKAALKIYMDIYIKAFFNVPFIRKVFSIKHFNVFILGLTLRRFPPTTFQ